jgi:hypothetical protein
MAAVLLLNGCNVTLPLDMTSGCGVNKLDHYAGLTPNDQIDWPAANAAIFDQRLLGLRGVDL